MRKYNTRQAPLSLLCCGSACIVLMGWSAALRVTSVSRVGSYPSCITTPAKPVAEATASTSTCSRFSALSLAQVRKQVKAMRGAGPVKDALRAAQRTEAEVGRLRRRAAALLERTAGRPEGSWRAFENILRVLVDAGEMMCLYVPGLLRQVRPMPHGPAAEKGGVRVISS